MTEIDPRNPEIAEVGSLLELAEALGFIETPEMRELRTEIVRRMAQSESFIEEYLRYEELAYQLDRLAEAEGQIALMVMKAQMFKESGDEMAFNEEMNDIICYASHAADRYPERFKDIVTAIERLKEEIKTFRVQTNHSPLLPPLK